MSKKGKYLKIAEEQFSAYKNNRPITDKGFVGNYIFEKIYGSAWKFRMN